LVPVAEEGTELQPESDGSLVLKASMATTWSESLRYEPAKGCLGYWKDAADLAEWGVQVSQPGKYQVILTQGCDKVNAGSTVQVEIAGQKMAFTVPDTGGFQQWQEVSLGTVEIAQSGKHYLTVTVQKMAHEAVMDVQKVLLKKVGA
jgi:arylsulfatase A